MMVIDHRQSTAKHKKYNLNLLQRHKVVFMASGAVVAVFVLANVVMSVAYHNRVLPNYSIATVSIGNTNFAALDAKVPIEKLLPAEVTFKKDDQVKKMTPRALGVAVDWAATRKDIVKTRSWLPLTSLWVKHSVPVELTVNESTFADSAQQLEAVFAKDPAPEHIAVQGDNFAIAAPETGYRLDTVNLRQSLERSLEQGKSELAVPTTSMSAPAPTGNLDGELKALQQQLGSKITLVSGSRSRQLSRAEIANFYEPSGQTLKPSADKMRQVINSVVSSAFGTTSVNQGEAVSASLNALNKHQAVTFVLANPGAQVYHYCADVRGESASVLTDLRQKLAAVYADPRGWGGNGKRAFLYGDSGCDFTVWLTAPSLMTTFGAICDDYYSCDVGSNVVINYDRWMGATDPWNAAGGNSEDYHVMVINHETGHRLGFGHAQCPGVGQLAPVMQQQSIHLDGCKFNPWPTATELAAL